MIGKLRRLWPETGETTLRTTPAPDMTGWLWVALILAAGAVIYAGIMGRRK